MKWAGRVFYFLLEIIFFISAVLSIIFFILPFGTLKKIGDSLSPDKNFQRFTPVLVQSIKFPALILGLILLVICTLALIFRKKTQSLIEKTILYLRRQAIIVLHDCRKLFNDIWDGRGDSIDGVLLTATVILGAVLRLVLIERPIEYDEAYTFTEFARHSFDQIISDYSVPNNHVFHTILVRLSYLIFGDGLWQIRLPVFISGLLIIVGMYFLARNLYDRNTGIITAILTSVFPAMVIKSVSARGYPIVVLMMVIALLFAEYVRQNKNKVAWFFLAFSCVMGIFTNPIMLYPCVFIYVWLFYLGMSKQVGQDYPGFLNWLKYLIASGFLIVAITAVFYSPILLGENSNQIWNYTHGMQASSAGKFFVSTSEMLIDLINEWKFGVSLYLWRILVAGILLSVIPNRITYKYRIPMMAIFIPCLIFMVLVQRPFPITRPWLWILPLFMMWSAAGISGAFQWLGQSRFARLLLYGFMGLFTLGLAINGIHNISSAIRSNVYVEDPAVQSVAAFLESRINEDDLVVVSGCSNVRYWYYFATANIPDQVTRDRDRAFNDVYVIAYTDTNPSCGIETVEEVLRNEGPDPVFLDMSKVDMIFKYKYISVYKIGTFPERIQKAFQIH